MKQMQVGALVRVPGRGRPYGEADKARAVEYAQRRLVDGAKVAHVAQELGISPKTVKKWTSCRAFERVEIVTETVQGLTLRGPRGVRVDGLSIDDIAELLRRLG